MDGENQIPQGEAISLRAAEQPSAPPATLPAHGASIIPEKPLDPVAAPAPSASQPSAELPAAPAAAIAPVPAPVTPAAATPVPPTPDSFADDPADSFAATGFDTDDQPDGQPAQDDSDLTWTASEFIDHSKNPGWYAALAGITVAVVVLVYFLTHHDFVTMAIILICAGLFGYTASRAPRQMQYGLSRSGVTIGPKFYAYQNFSAFAVVNEGVFSSIDLMPLKRFMPILSVYYDPQNEDRILDTLTAHLPVTHHHRTFIDDLMHRIHF